MFSKSLQPTFPYTQPTALYALFQGSLFFTATVLSSNLDSSKPGTWAIFGIICALVSCFWGLIPLVYTRYRLGLSIWKAVIWGFSVSGGAMGVAILIFGSGSWKAVAAILWGWSSGAGGVVLGEMWEERKGRGGELPEYARVGG